MSFLIGAGVVCVLIWLALALGNTIVEIIFLGKKLAEPLSKYSVYTYEDRIKNCRRSIWSGWTWPGRLVREVCYVLFGSFFRGLYAVLKGRP